ncbi:LpqN/LpqT family lipoprotein [Mycobacteroides chelonae]|uniref:LpqN/LpqT family lipoprotein n=1 Tax=Mycobacteroides chelonae TaxID=1774 RepID=UPI000993A20F|nr:LpqN/LpqT family lipoprotein [Mycobacteroides chelonae]
MRTERPPVALSVAALCLTVTLAACGGASKDNTSTTSSKSSASSSTTTTSAVAQPDKSKLSPRNLQSKAGAANYTIADYIKDQNITETLIHQGDPGAPEVAIQFPDGWVSAGPDTPDYAYGAIVYTGPEAQGANYTPNIIAILSRLDGNVDPAQLLTLAGNEMKNLPEFVPVGDGSAEVSGYRAYRIAGSYNLDGIKAASGQETVVIPSNGALYILQMNATSNEEQSEALFTAMSAIDKSITITP